MLAIILAAMCSQPAGVYAQSGNPIDPNCDPLDPACPIDSGTIVLLTIGALYGIKKISDSRKHKAAAL